jgi:pyruvate dehydrogenase E2 component (dihydrolipoamide acetyltransferase)
MADALRMPKLGQEMTEGRVVEWLKSVGDEVAAGELIALVETDKTTVDLESPASGYVGAFTVDVDETVDVGTVIAWILEQPDEAVPTSVGTPAKDPAGPASAPAIPPAGADASSPGTGPAAGGIAVATGERVPASPRARRLAEQLGVDLATVTPTGPQGWVTAEDVEATIVGTVDAPALGDEALLTPMRKAIAAQMTRSALVPQYRVTREVDVTDLAARLNTQPATITDAVVWATARALSQHPDVNASWSDGSPPTVVRHPRIVVGVAVAVDAGLIVPVIAGADRLTLDELHEQRVQLETAARSGTLSSGQLHGATFTVSNLGSLGVDEFAALVNPPEAGILAVGSARRRAVVVDDSVAVRTTVMLTFAGDHRVIDGAAGARFLATVAALLASPAADGGQ